MKRFLVPLIISMLTILYISACTSFSPSEPETVVSEPTITPTITPVTQTPVLSHTPSLTPSLTPLPSMTPAVSLSDLEAPLLLIQTGFYEYQYLSPKNQLSIPVELPVIDPNFRLSANRSPSGDLMFFPQQENTGKILNLITGEVVHTYNFESPALFNPEQAVLEAQPLVTELGLTDAGLLDAVNQAHQSSTQLLRWFRDDRYHLSVQDSGETSTALFLDDHHTGTRLQLEDKPGLVENFMVGPDGETILLKKGFIFTPGAYRDDQYYLINIKDNTTQILQLPEDVQNPSVNWFSENTISVIHQASMIGGSGFSLIDTRTMEISQIITGDFSNLRRVGSHILTIQHDNQIGNTTFELLSLEGQLVASQVVESRCYFQFTVGNHMIIQCDLDSFIMDQELSIEPFFDSILTLNPAPDRSMYVMVSRSDQSFLLDPDLNILYELPLEETPVEIRWLPDSSGFLYRTYGRLHYFDLISQTGYLLLESDLFSDYININAVWINFD